MNKSKLKNFVKRCIAEVIVEGNVENPISVKTKNIIYGELERMGFQLESSGYMGHDTDEDENGYAGGIYCLVDTKNNVVKIESSYYDEESERYELDIDQSLPIPDLYSDEPDMNFINAVISFYRKKLPEFNKTKKLGEGNSDPSLEYPDYRDGNGQPPTNPVDKWHIKDKDTYHPTSCKKCGAKWTVGHVCSSNLREAGEQKPERISNSERNKIGNAFAKLGLDGNGRFVKKEHGLGAVNSALQSLGFQLDMVSADIIMGDKGSRNFTFRRVNDEGQDAFTEKPEIINSRIVFNWELLSPDKFEVLAYAS